MDILDMNGGWIIFVVDLRVSFAWYQPDYKNYDMYMEVLLNEGFISERKTCL
jgi:hypothetical protein